MNNPQPSATPTVVVARLQDQAQVEAFCAIAAEAGVPVRIRYTKCITAGFDGTLGGSNQIMGYALHINPSQLPALRNHLVSSMETDPLDPLQTASSAELLAMVEGPMVGNLCEQILAAKILASRPAVATPQAATIPTLDHWLQPDLKVARWLGLTGLFFTAIYLAILNNALNWGGNEYSTYQPVMVDAGLGISFHSMEDGIAQNIRPFLIMLLPMGTGAALILSWRTLRDGSRRRMFPKVWRITGYFLFWVPFLLMITLTSQLFSFYSLYKWGR